MPTTPKGIPYPSLTDTPNVPLDMQELAEAVDALAFGVRMIRRTTTQTVTNSTTLVNDTVLKLNLAPGTWRLQAYLRVTGPAAADVKTAWTFTGSISALARDCIGPAPSTTDANAGVVRTSFQGTATPVPYGTDGTNGSVIVEDLLLVVSVPGDAQLQWAQNTANATGTVMNGQSRLYAHLLTN